MQPGYSSATRGQIEGSAPSLGPSSLIAAGAVVAGLYFGRDVLVPFVVAVLLSFVLAIPVRLLQGWGLGRTFPVAVVVLFAFLVIASIGAVLTTQLADLAGELPRYQQTIRDKVATLKNAASGHGPLERLADMLQGISDEVAGKPKGVPGLPSGGQNGAAPKPVPVEITNGGTSSIGTITGYVASVVHPLATTGLVAIFVVFILMQRGDLRNRAIRLAGSGDLQRTTAAMNDAARRLSGLFLAQVLLNAGFGVVTGIGLWAIGVPSPVLWGILAAISRFIPYVGVVLAAGGPLVLAAAVDPNWSMLVSVAAFFVVSEVLLGQMIEPLVFGHSTGLSPIAVILSVTFWTWLWGPAGLLLATPLTVCLVVLGRHVDRLEFLDVMLGDRPPLTAAESFYQRVLAGDAGEAIEQAETFLRDHSLVTYYDEIAVKGLALAQVDLSRSALDPARLARIADTMAEIVEDLAERETPQGETKRQEVKRAAGDEDLDASLDAADALSVELPTLSPDELAPEWRESGGVLCLAGRNDLDRAAALMLAQILEKHGLQARVEGAEALAPGGLVRTGAPAARVVCLSYLDTGSPVHVRYAVRRVRRHLPGARVIVGSWGVDEKTASGLCETSRSDSCASRLIEAARACLDAAQANAGRTGVARVDGARAGEVASSGRAGPAAPVPAERPPAVPAAKLVGADAA